MGDLLEFRGSHPETEMDTAPAWETCWEEVLCLSGTHLSDDALFVEAKRLVRICRAGTADRDIEWFKNEVEDAQAFVAEQIAIDPHDRDWRRIEALLHGCEAGLDNTVN